MANKQNTLVSQSSNQSAPRDAKPSEFKVGNKFTDKSTSTPDKLMALSENQEGCRHDQDGGAGKHGAGTPAKWTTGYTPKKSPIEGTPVKHSLYVDLKTGGHCQQAK